MEASSGPYHGNVWQLYRAKEEYQRKLEDPTIHGDYSAVVSIVEKIGEIESKLEESIRELFADAENF